MNSRGAFLTLAIILAGAGVALAQPRIRFERSRFDILPGEVFDAQVIIQSTNASGLSSFGVKLSFPEVNAFVANAASVQVWQGLDYDGVRGAGSIKAVGAGVAAAKGTVNFASSPLRASTDPRLVSFRITDRSSGSYILALSLYNTLGPTEEIFVDGKGGVLDSNLIFEPAIVNHRPLVRLVDPTNGAVFLTPTVLSLRAEAEDIDGAVAKVEFYADGQKVGETSASPYRLEWLVGSTPPGEHILTAVAQDNYGAANTSGPVRIRIQENSMPVLGPIGDRIIDELTLLTFTAVATDSDVPPQTLTFSLAAGAPAGAHIDGNSGLFVWTPSESQGPSSNRIGIVVSDSAGGHASREFTVLVRESNQPPALSPISDRRVLENSALTLVVAATDPDIPAQRLTFSLEPGAPAGAAIDAASGLFTWVPNESQGPSTNRVTVRVADDGTPVLFDIKSFVVIVEENEIRSEPYAIFAGESGQSKGAKILNFNGNSHSISGRVHSNSDIDVTGNSHTFRNALIENVTGIRMPPSEGRVLLIDSRITNSTVLAYPVDYTWAEFAPGGSSATLAAAQRKYFHVRGNTHLEDYIDNHVLREGLYFVEGDIHLTGSVRGKVTLVASGEIQLSGSGGVLESFMRCLLAFSSQDTGRWRETAVSVSGSGLRWQGVIFSPGGAINLTGSENLVSLGSLIGRSVVLGGHGLQLTGIDLLRCRPLVAPLVPVIAGSDLVLSFSTVAGLSYSVEFRDSLADGPWQTLATVTGDGATKLFRSANSGPQRFFRLRLQ